MTVAFQYEASDFPDRAEPLRKPESLAKTYYFGIIPVLGVALAIAIQSFPIAMGFTVLYMLSGWFVQQRLAVFYKRTIYSEENLSFSTRPWQATLNKEGLSFSSGAADVLYRWPCIREVIRDSRYIYFVLTPIIRVRIPVRAFSAEEDVQKFVSLAQSYLKNGNRADPAV
jgi:hypothetical protein